MVFLIQEPRTRETRGVILPQDHDVDLHFNDRGASDLHRTIGECRGRWTRYPRSSHVKTVPATPDLHGRGARLAAVLSDGCEKLARLYRKLSTAPGVAEGRQ